MRENKMEVQRAVLAMAVLNKNDDPIRDLDELKNLAEAAGAVVVGQLFQNKDKPDVSLLLGKGKVQELKEIIKETNANLVIFDNQLSGSKINNLENELNVKVIDRGILILDIFAQRALSNEGKLQVELAQLEYNLPRINAISGSSGRYGSGGIGMRGPGETKIELNKRIMQNRILEKKKALQKLKADRNLRRKKRDNNDKKLVAIVGYTNSGKSTLLNTITKSGVLAKDMLFATLDTTTRNVWLNEKKQFLLVDTVGFVNKLPHELVEAFSSTLEETLYADVLIHVIDSSNPKHEIQEQVVLNVLSDLGVKDKPIIRVFNKVDKLNNLQMEEDAIYISAKNNHGIEKLKLEIEKYL